MANFVTLHTPSFNRPFIINVEQIISCHQLEGHVDIYAADDCDLHVQCRETLEELLELFKTTSKEV